MFNMRKEIVPHSNVVDKILVEYSLFNILIWSQLSTNLYAMTMAIGELALRFERGVYKSSIIDGQNEEYLENTKIMKA